MKGFFIFVPSIIKTMLLFFNLGGGEIFAIIAVTLMLFGSKRIPEIARTLGRGIRQFKDATGEIQRDIEKNIKQTKDDIDVTKHFKP